ncbi:MAG TPA: acyl-CoA thioesterase [Nevskia sp.]|nr:acyl-CoA thioesterase [Nevskia sp.]
MRSAEVEIEVPFHDVDMVGIVWHGHYAKYFELARCALLETFNYNYMQMMASGYGWPVIDLRLRYVKPAQFGQKIRVRATLLEWENRLRIEYLVSDAVSGERLTKGETVQVAVHAATREMCLVSPDVLFERLGEPKP